MKAIKKNVNIYIVKCRCGNGRGFLTEVVVKPFWDLATLHQMRKVTSAVRTGEMKRFLFS
jgi:hypothetical protein